MHEQVSPIDEEKGREEEEEEEEEEGEMVDISIVFARYTHEPCTRAIRRDFSSHLGNWICGLHLEIASCGILPILSRWARIDLSNISRFDELNEDCFFRNSGLGF